MTSRPAPVTLRLPSSVLNRIDALTADRQRRETHRIVTRAEVLRLLLARGLEHESTVSLQRGAQ